ncbi:TetR family transcriptional regulator C-terminal domain-containing protein [Phormidium sp. FACHB-592]|uniref:TetR family transcriptional regulator C-terminal domain-containing protein n=1 Tax=Stenomitos frigidus AS-A4 TaxID=2933935 RepID=A0ABV0KMK8_9CYAN|nr:TetR/AcrR family transcriptional regulator [Phormidium sp. FACHB-592]MBD2077111.1 TetR family transcriptional regulator C-terminal domain-containing protein [Phormidium sp. FACHB-592]
MVNLKRTRDDVLLAVLDLIHRQGFHSTGLKELLSSSGVSSGSFYNYFASKDELGHALIDFKWSKLKLLLFSVRQLDAIAQLFQMIDQLEAIHQAEDPCAGCFLGNLIVELVEHNPSFRQHLIQVFDEWQQEIATLLQAGRAQLKPEIDPDRLAQQLLSAIEGALLLGRLYDNPQRLRHCLDGCRSLLKSSLHD